MLFPPAACAPCLKIHGSHYTSFWPGMDAYALNCPRHSLGLTALSASNKLRKALSKLRHLPSGKRSPLFLITYLATGSWGPRDFNRQHGRPGKSYSHPYARSHQKLRHPIQEQMFDAEAAPDRRQVRFLYRTQSVLFFCSRLQIECVHARAGGACACVRHKAVEWDIRQSTWAKELAYEQQLLSHIQQTSGHFYWD